MSVIRVLAIALVVTALGCVEPRITTCEDGTICPSDQACSPRGGCVDPDRFAQCVDPPADGSCTLPGGDPGGCFDGLCLPLGCGNGVMEAGEACDDGNRLAGDQCSANCRSDERCGNAYLDSNLGDGTGEGCDCGDADFTGERPGGCIGPNSDDPDAPCTADCLIRGCGDGVVAGLEDCDSDAIPLTSCTALDWYGGSLGCHPTCRYNTSGCAGRCGDGTRTDGEQCDTGELGGMTCQSFGYYYPGGLACNALCGFDASGCTGSCGDGVFDAGQEACDPSETEVDLAARGLDCTDLGYYAPAGLACTASCQLGDAACEGGYCGDGIAQVGEECDAAALGIADCTDFGFYAADTLGCRANCTYDLALCTGGRCGDGVDDAVEQCDGAVPDGTDCLDFGFHAAGPVTCTAACSVDTSECLEWCGDLLLNGQEVCDGSVPVAIDCTDFGYYQTNGLTCSNGCTINTAGCIGICGDAVVDVVEDCEPGAALTVDCTDFAYYEPAGLACTGSCGFDTNACEERCGDGLVNGPEPCDGAPPSGYACSLVGLDAGLLGCADGCYETFDRCARFGWEPEPVGGDPAYSLKDVWVHDDVAIAVSSVIMRRVDGAWSVMTSAMPSRTMYGVWGAAADDVFAVGNIDNTRWGIQHFDGVAWSAMTGPATPLKHLKDVDGTGPNNVWAVGDEGTVLRYTGTWARLTTPIAATAYLFGVWTSGADVFVVGSDAAGTGIIYRYDGISWTNQSVAAPNTFLAVWGRAANDVYAVTSEGVVWRYNGSSWTSMGGCAGVYFEDIGGLDGAPVVAVGHDSSLFGAVCQLAGGTWHRLDIGGVAVLNGVAGRGDELLAVGDSMTALRSDGASWIPVTSPTLPTMNAIWGTSGSNLYVVGAKISTLAEGVQRWNGTSWVGQNEPGGIYTMRSVWGGTGWVVAVGTGGRILANDTTNTTWSAQASGVTSILNGVWGDANNIYAVGDGGVIRRRAPGGTTWTASTSNTANSLNAVWGVPGGPVFAVGASGTIVRNVSGTWGVMPSPTTATLSSVWGRSATDVYAVGSTGTILHYDGASWTRIPTGVSEAFYDVWGQAGDLFLTTVSDVYQLTGGRVLRVTLPIASYAPTALWGTSDVTYVLRNGFQVSLLALGGRLFRTVTDETVCDDFWDDDSDGLTDCADPQCGASTACLGGGACAAAIDVACGDTIAGTTIGGSTRWPFYGNGCVDRALSGREAHFRVRRATAGTISLALSGYTGDLDLIVASQTAGGACTPDEGCLAAGQTAAAGGTEAASFSATASTDYTVIVDGFESVNSAFQLQVTCP